MSKELTSLSKKFEKAARPLMKFMAQNYHPHVKAIVTSCDAELVEGLMCTPQILDYVWDGDPNPQGEETTK